MALLKVSSDIRLGKGFQSKLQRDIHKIEEMAPKNTLLRVVMKRNGPLFETEMESIGGPSRTLFTKARAKNAFAAFKMCRDLLIKQIQKQVGKTRTLTNRRVRSNKQSLTMAQDINGLTPEID